MAWANGEITAAAVSREGALQEAFHLFDAPLTENAKGTAEFKPSAAILFFSVTGTGPWECASVRIDGFAVKKDGTIGTRRTGETWQGFMDNEAATAPSWLADLVAARLAVVRGDRS